MPWIPHDYQKKAIRFGLENAMAGFFLDMGLGKTAITLAIMKILLAKGIIKRILIIAPLRVCWTVWPAEVKKWTDFEGLRVEVLHGPRKEEALRRDADIYVINPDGLEWLMLEQRAEKLRCDVLVVDESSAFKHSETLRFKLLKYILPHFRRRYILTGTPAPNGLLDLFGQVFILDGGAALGSYVTHYRMRYFKHPDYIHPRSGQAMQDTYRWVLKDGREELIYDKLRPLVLRMEAADYLELPERIDNIVYIQLPEKAKKVYYELEHAFITLLENGESLVAPSVAAMGVKLRQISNGGVYRNMENRALARTHQEEWVHMHDEKLDALEEIRESRIGKPVLVAYEFTHDATRLRARFPNAVFLADFEGQAVEQVVNDWNDGNIQMLCAHPASAGHGLNLQKDKDTLIWFGLTWNLEHYQQFNARVLRQGNTSPHVFVHHIIAKGTLDEAVMMALRAKAKTQADLLDAMKAYARKEQIA